MWRSIVIVLLRQRGKSLLASSGFLLAACALVLLSATTQTTVVQANKLINQNWQPTYDLVILPNTVHLPSQGSIPPDYLQSYGGGISIQQYTHIKSLPGVEVAAPIAYIGYLSLPLPRFYLPNQRFPTGYYQLTWTLTAFNGQRHLVEYRESKVYYVDPCYGAGYNFFLVDDIVQQGYPDIGSCKDARAQSLPTVMDIPAPETGTFLLAAIDPTVEDQLVHLNTAITQGRMFTAQETIQKDPRLPKEVKFYKPGATPGIDAPLPVQEIPLLIHQQLPGQIGLNVQFQQLAQGQIPSDDLKRLGGSAYLARLTPQRTILNGPVPLVQDNPQRFAGANLAWNGRTWITSTSPISSGPGTIFQDFYRFLLDIPYTQNAEPAGLTYQPTSFPGYSSAFALVPNNVQGPEVGFRPLQPLHTLKQDLHNVVYTYNLVGQFSDMHLAAQFNNPLNWLPENTYTVPPTILRYDAQGHPITPTTLLPTTNRSGFLTQPPLALTTLEAARQLKGDNLISAIRVRVSGVNHANEESWKHIQQVASEIQQATHLQVVVTLGSSPQPTLVFVPGLKQGQLGAVQNIAPIGWVEERWIFIGVSLRYLLQLGAIRFVLIGAVLAVCLGYLGVAFSTLLATQQQEFAILSALGWRPWHPMRLFLGQALLLAISGGTAGLLLSLLIIRLLEAQLFLPVVIWTLPAILAMGLLCALYPLWQIWHLHPATILRSGTATVERQRHGENARSIQLTSLGSLAWRNLTRARARTLITIVSLFLSAALLVLMLNTILSLRQALSGTLLGNFVLLQTAIPQIAGAFFAVMLTFLSVADLLLLQLRERQREIGLLQAVGWRLSQIQHLFLQEGLLLVLLSTLPGVLVAEGILLLQQANQIWLSLLLVPFSAICIMLTVALLATLPTMRALSQANVVKALRGE